MSNNTENIDFTVIIPLYNRASSIRKTLDSVLNQTYKNFEVLIIDDGSTDRPDIEIEKIKDPRIKLYRQSNAGGGAARNKGIELAKGRFIAFLDSDDIWLDFHLEQSLEVLKDFKNICIYGQVIVDRGNGVKFLKPPKPLKENDDISEYLLCDRGFFQTSSIILHSEIARSNLFNPKINYGQDTDFCIRLASKGIKFIKSEKPSVVWIDEYSQKRLSSKIDPKIRESWLKDTKSILSDRAYYGCLGWSVAKGYAQHGRKLFALKLYLIALLKRCYSPKLSIVVFLQIILSNKSYRVISDKLAKYGISP